MKPELKRFMKVGMIVDHVEEYVKNWEAMGIGPWNISEMRNDVAPFEDIRFNGEELPKGLIMKTATLTGYGFELELMEPVAETPFKEWLREHGPGLHHLAFDLERPYEEFVEDAKKLTGKDTWAHGWGIGGMMDFSFLDMRDQLGLFLECYGKLLPGKSTLPYDTIGEITTEE